MAQLAGGLERVYGLSLAPAKLQTVAIQAPAAGQAGDLDKAGNNECDCLLLCPNGCPAKPMKTLLMSQTVTFPCVSPAVPLAHKICG